MEQDHEPTQTPVSSPKGKGAGVPKGKGSKTNLPEKGSETNLQSSESSMTARYLDPLEGIREHIGMSSCEVSVLFKEY